MEEDNADFEFWKRFRFQEGWASAKLVSALTANLNRLFDWPVCHVQLEGKVSSCLEKRGVIQTFTMMATVLQVTEDRLISLLEQINEQQQTRTKVTVRIWL